MQRMLAVLWIVLLSSILILGCDGGEEFSDTLDVPMSSSLTPETPETNVVLSGVVATGELLQGVVQAINVRGETSDEVNADAEGRFDLDISNHPPFMLRMIPHGEGVELFSFAASEGHVNLTPLTHLAMYVAVGAEIDLEDLFHEWDGSQLSPEEVQIAAATVRANLAPLLHQQGLHAGTYDIFHTTFNADGTGVDAVLDTVRIRIDPSAETLSRSIRILDTSDRDLLTFDPAATLATTATSSANVQPQKDASE